MIDKTNHEFNETPRSGRKHRDHRAMPGAKICKPVGLFPNDNDGNFYLIRALIFNFPTTLTGSHILAWGLYPGNLAHDHDGNFYLIRA
ncbi:hypothetical protein [Dyadobacter sp. 3J3]|uniref:hypothetical protein n=1 Tax=Dyadobacter sp. 3J3 TaxID=2606600 RepID=UPI00135C58DA|nr:hypothetical protein [Dyadobacter sp. 3J3]